MRRFAQEHQPALLRRASEHLTAITDGIDPFEVLDLQVRGGRDAAIQFTNRLKVFTRATSLGGTESLIEHRHSIEGPETRTINGLPVYKDCWKSQVVYTCSLISAVIRATRSEREIKGSSSAMRARIPRP